ncbi:MAG: exonuclease SbcCD subunit D C-terminal domain-containing protein [Saprospiraceae bacterium]|nr:exonuclease SbcCD subunit D C-terminal domain-containing protein [Saprospiraceae bacterium]
MKILHTGDWHLGKQLYREELREEQHQYFEFLLNTIKKEAVDVLLVSGDVFDYANPSNESKKMYLDFLGALKQQGDIKVVITAGNHDSITYLESSKQVLQLLDIQVVGSPENVSLLPMKEGGEVKAVVIPIPFIADRFLRKGMEMASEEDKIEACRQALISVFDSWSKQAAEAYPGIPRICVGHLFIQGANVSDSERKIQIGNLASLNVSHLDHMFEYMALGHIHKPQKLSEKVRYAGSPVALSFSERSDDKLMILIEIEEDTIKTRNIAVPTFRKLVRFSGTFAEVKEKLEAYRNEFELPTFVELEVKESFYDPAKIVLLKDLEASYQTSAVKVLSTKIMFTERETATEGNRLSGKQLNELDPIEVFEERFKSEALEAEDKSLMRMAFLEILEEVQSTLTYENQ